ncbi:MAG: type II secretion system F family protein [Fimbriimonadia bacterium]|jgi:type IV pilus assembly protein PilC
MPIYRYKAYETSGARVQDTIEASDEKDALRKLAYRGLTVASIQVEAQTHAARGRRPVTESSGIGVFGPKLKPEDTAVLCRELAIMIDAGVPISEALTSLAEAARHPAILRGLNDVLAQIRNGASLSEAIRVAPRVFPGLLADIVSVAEEGGSLPTALDTAASHIEQSLDFRRKVRSALIYPVLLLSIAVITAAVLITFVLPRFTKIFENMGVETPTSTQALLAVSGFLHGAWPYIFGTCVALWVVWRRLMKERPFCTNWTRGLMRLPIAGDLMRKVALARALAVLSSLLSCNVPLLRALTHAGKVTGNPVYEDSFTSVASRVEGGRSLAEALGEADAIPHLIIQMTAVGERTGSLAAVLGKTAAFIEADVDNKLRSLTSIIEPLMIVGLGVFIGFITISVIAPIYSLVGQVR